MIYLCINSIGIQLNYKTFENIIFICIIEQILDEVVLV